jgi:hypothetical protein
MKLAVLLLGTVLGASAFAPGLASADEVLQPPSGPVIRVERVERVERAERRDALRAQHRDDLRAQHRANRARRAGELRRALVATFDVDGDGKLDARERHRAARVLRRIEQRLSTDGRAGGRGARRGPAPGEI